jgi:hypothetical protein
MKMIRNQSPSITPATRFDKQSAQPGKEAVPVRIIGKYGIAGDSPDNDMVQTTWTIYSGLTRHGETIKQWIGTVNLNI